MIRIRADMASVLGGCNGCGRHDCLIYEVGLRGIEFRLCERCLVALILKAECLMEGQSKRRKGKRGT